jgi:hypothetical protein
VLNGWGYRCCRVSIESNDTGWLSVSENDERDDGPKRQQWVLIERRPHPHYEKSRNLASLTTFRMVHTSQLTAPPELKSVTQPAFDCCPSKLPCRMSINIPKKGNQFALSLFSIDFIIAIASQAYIVA